MSDLTRQEREILNILQKEFPLVERPFAQVAERVGISEADLLAKIARWRESGLLRRLGPVFDSKRIGYKSLLVAVAVPEEELAETTAVINAYPGVTHNYLRETLDGWPLRYNLWFTMTGATSSEVEENLNGIKEKTGNSDLLPLPAHRLYKIKVQFFLGAERGALREEGGYRPPKREARPVELSPADWRLIEAFQNELEPVPEPFAPVAASCDLSPAELLEQIKTLLAKGVIRRFGATLKHYAVGYGSNAMGVWAVPAEREEEVGKIMASFKAVSHCYARTTYPQWPYNLYTMLHAGSMEELKEIAAEISQATGITDYHLLHTVKEFKKIRMVYRAPRRMP
ncbi:MAG: Lrp/AsnC family transcriptional regulator [Firmicutes bacterium]|nr:Lrp/AsnC family transcriptional regulator [Bacillota bacterium]